MNSELNEALPQAPGARSSAQPGEELLVAIEGGGTKTRILLADAGGHVVAKEVGGPASGLYIDPAKYARETRALLQRIKKVVRSRKGYVSTVGLGGPMDPELVAGLVARVFDEPKIVRTGESEIALAVYELSRGISLVAGTGASCRALGDSGKWVGCGGFGPQFGDEGSGYWIGRSAVSAIMRAEDGRGPKTLLTEALFAYFGIVHVGHIFRFVDRSGHISGTQIASFTPYVFEAARKGDRVAAEICRQAGDVLGRLVTATAHKVEWRSQPIGVVPSGGVFFGGPFVMEPFEAVLKADDLVYDLYPSLTEPAEGIFKVMLKERKGQPAVSSAENVASRAALARHRRRRNRVS